MGKNQDKEKKKELVKEIILSLHKGLTVEEAKDRIEREVGSITSTEIAEIEQSLIKEGLSLNEIKKSCNVHALLFETSLEEKISEEEPPDHPVHLFKLENREIEKITDRIREIIKNKDRYELMRLKQEIKNLLIRLRDIDIHYARKEQLLFPFLEKYGFPGPSKVMWGIDNDIRDLLKMSILKIEDVNNETELNEYMEENLDALIDDVDGMIFKEENILFPTSIEKLNKKDWVEIMKESDEVGYAYIEGPKKKGRQIKESEKVDVEEQKIEGGKISLPTGELQFEELLQILNTLPVDISFVDKDDRVKYFSDNEDRIFVRTKSVIGRKVQNCHPPQSVDVVEKILRSFKEGKKDSVDFWINLKGKFIHIRFFAIRDKTGKYLGTMEVVQDVTEIRKLEGEKRLLDERD